MSQHFAKQQRVQEYLKKLKANIQDIKACMRIAGMFKESKK